MASPILTGTQTTTINAICLNTLDIRNDPVSSMIPNRIRCKLERGVKTEAHPAMNTDANSHLFRNKVYATIFKTAQSVLESAKVKIFT